jgi:alpha-D-ribose 1-methylphosphonate 5-triphosphate synthase subunit PhnI
VTGQPVTVGWFRATEVEMFGPEHDRKEGKGARLLPNFGLSYGLVIGQQERKAIAMSILDSALQAAAEEGEGAPSNDQEMVLSHVDGIESTGFVEHLKLPHYVTFGAAMRAQEVPLGTRRMVAAGRALGDAPAARDEPPERAVATAGAAGGGRD